MTPIKGIVVGHGDLAAALIGAVEQISGPGSGLVAISNADCDRGRLEERIINAATPGPSLVFIDLPSGSCHFAAMHRLHAVSDVRVVTGVNLAMLLDFTFHRDGELDAVADHVAAVGTRAVVTR
jgi:mannose/fructose-specific phosphotransferase system component IIA